VTAVLGSVGGNGEWGPGRTVGGGREGGVGTERGRLGGRKGGGEATAEARSRQVQDHSQVQNRHTSDQLRQPMHGARSIFSCLITFSGELCIQIHSGDSCVSHEMRLNYWIHGKTAKRVTC
jgi:hypothetical protein